MEKENVTDRELFSDKRLNFTFTLKMSALLTVVPFQGLG